VRVLRDALMIYALNVRAWSLTRHDAAAAAAAARGKTAARRRIHQRPQQNVRRTSRGVS